MARTPKATSILLLDPQTSTRRLLRRLLEHQADRYPCVEESASAAQALEQCRHCPPRLLLMEASLPDASAQEFIYRVHQQGHGTRILLFTDWLRRHPLRSFLGVGVHGMIFREERLATLLRAIRCLLSGGYHYTCALNLPGAIPSGSLPAPQHQTLCLIAQGYTPGQIATALRWPFTTLERHTEALLRHLTLPEATRLIL